MTRRFYRHLLAMFGVAALLGCATPHTTSSPGFTEFIAYEGNQANWPRAASSLMKQDFAVPAYLGLPSRPYRVLGFIVNDEPIVSDQGLPNWLWSDETRLANACNRARDCGADAVLLTKDPALVRALTPAEGHTVQSYRLLTNFDGVIVAVRWTDH